jgi:hypothetical protein
MNIQTNQRICSFIFAVLMVLSFAAGAQTWKEMGGLDGLAATGRIFSICSDASGNVYAGGAFTNSNFHYYIAEYNSGTGIHPLASNFNVNIFPNPTNGNFTVSFPEKVNNASVEIDNVSGERVFSQTIRFTLKTEVSLKNISAGVYYVKVMNGEQQSYSKIIVQ